MYISLTQPEIKRLLDALPGLRGKRKGDILVEPFRGPVNVNSYWSGGSRSEYALIDLETLRSWSVPTSHPYFDGVGNLELSELPPNTALVRGGIFCGKPATIRILLREENLTKLLPSKVELSKELQSALNIIRSYTSGYRKEEFSRCGLGQYSPNNPHIVELAAMGLVKVNKAGSVTITTEGRNATT